MIAAHPLPTIDMPLAGVDPAFTSADGIYSEAEMAGRCRQLWAAAFALYVEDAAKGMQGRAGDYGREALFDLGGKRYQLDWLCQCVGLDSDAVAWRLLDTLTTPSGAANGTSEVMA
ncbi:hypothetical protein [Afifella aestuarii]|uniref:hypothetical protein n=1 Tax=Afifella aestuarii TaxID=1909496 RepID=UPI000FE2C455|nr:hypothetical protein [Afifella aestuarii]